MLEVFYSHFPPLDVVYQILLESFSWSSSTKLSFKYKSEKICHNYVELLINCALVCHHRNERSSIVHEIKTPNTKIPAEYTPFVLIVNNRTKLILKVIVVRRIMQNAYKSKNQVVTCHIRILLQYSRYEAWRCIRTSSQFFETSFLSISTLEYRLSALQHRRDIYAYFIL